MKRQRTEANSESKRNGATPAAAASDAPPLASAETNTATTLAIILRTLEKMQAQVTNIQETQLSLISAQRHLSNQVLDLQNHKKKFFTSLRDLPIEVIVRIFAWIPPRSVFRCRRLSRTINQCLLTTQFAVLNMQTAAFQNGSESTIGGLWLVVPQPYQRIAARAMATQVKSIVGSNDEESDDEESNDDEADYQQVEKRLPKSISYLTAVEEIIMQNYTLIGEIPDTFGALKNLTMLRLRGNSLTGPLPSSLNLLSRLTFLDLSHNQLSGDFPALPNLHELMSICITQNRFTGPVPTVFGDPRKLIYFYAADNCFSILPGSIGQLTNLDELFISRNVFSCEIPSEIWNVAALKFFEVSGCKLFGSLAGVGNLRNLRWLDVSNNQLSGEFPTREILHLENLEKLHLVGNQFSGGEYWTCPRGMTRLPCAWIVSFKKLM